MGFGFGLRLGGPHPVAASGRSRLRLAAAPPGGAAAARPGEATATAAPGRARPMAAEAGRRARPPIWEARGVRAV